MHTCVSTHIHGQIFICVSVYVCVCVVLGKTLWTSQTAKGFMIKHLKILHRPSSFLSPHAVIAQSSERLSNASPRLRPVSEAMLRGSETRLPGLESGCCFFEPCDCGQINFHLPIFSLVNEYNSNPHFRGLF